MKAIVNTEPGKLEMMEVPIPEPGNGQVRIKTAAFGICATDLAMMDGCTRSRYPQILGHEWSGVIDGTGPDIDSGLVGKACVAENVLVGGGEVGFEHPGGYGEYFLTDADNVRLLPKGFSMMEAALIEPLAVSVRGIRRLRIEDYSSALILGDGPIGLIMAMLLKKAGVGKIVLAGGRKGRLKIAAMAGAVTINYHDHPGDLVGGIENMSAAKFANVIEAAGSKSAADAAFDLAASGGHILMIGDYDTFDADFSWQSFLHRELDIIASNASAGAWDEAVELASGGEIKLGRLISGTYPAIDYRNAMEMVRSKSGDCVKFVVKWE